jgi:hypothetical protein
VCAIAGYVADLAALEACFGLAGLAKLTRTFGRGLRPTLLVVLFLCLLQHLVVNAEGGNINIESGPIVVGKVMPLGSHQLVVDDCKKLAAKEICWAAFCYTTVG